MTCYDCLCVGLLLILICFLPVQCICFAHTVGVACNINGGIDRFYCLLSAAELVCRKTGASCETDCDQLYSCT
ncbi:uncharacterized protein V1518DRAFT_414432 [Limtongia smithiae]|uniref:uncharacterized protein n=1 Tax=Limtongia smithiae TaxID=1125753 RepID=UPI0034CE87B2